jgi:hypothetical protein
MEDPAALHKEKSSHNLLLKSKLSRKIALGIGLIIGIGLIFWLQRELISSKNSNFCQEPRDFKKTLEPEIQKSKKEEHISTTSLGAIASQMFLKVPSAPSKEITHNSFRPDILPHQESKTEDNLLKESEFKLFVVKHMAFERLKDQILEGRPYGRSLERVQALFSKSQRGFLIALEDYAETGIHDQPINEKSKISDTNDHKWLEFLRSLIQIRKKDSEKENPKLLSFQGDDFSSRYQRLPPSILKALDSLQQELLEMDFKISEGILHDSEKHVSSS